MSIINELPFLYRVGFNHPTGDILALKRAALMRETIPAKTGVDAEVPDKLNHCPPIIVRYDVPASDTSG
jgi:hypothetical protein